jgi:hypothetical protein
MPRVSGCPEPLANAELRNAAEKFFKRTRAWREWSDLITLRTVSREYDLDPPVGSYVVRIERATLNGSPFPIDGAFDLAGNPLLQSVGDGISSADRVVLTMSSTPVDGGKLSVFFSLAPSLTASGIPDHLFTQYADAILEGALGEIRMVPNETFTDDGRAAVNLAKFEAAMDRTVGQVFRSNTNTVPRARVSWC